jgi:hypothetical protein
MVEIRGGSIRIKKPIILKVRGIVRKNGAIFYILA